MKNAAPAACGRCARYTADRTCARHPDFGRLSPRWDVCDHFTPRPDGGAAGLTAAQLGQRLAAAAASAEARGGRAVGSEPVRLRRDVVAEIDRLRGGQSRSRWLAGLLGLAR